jgi:hypothetical protein
MSNIINITETPNTVTIEWTVGSINQVVINGVIKTNYSLVERQGTYPSMTLRVEDYFITNYNNFISGSVSNRSVRGQTGEVLVKKESGDNIPITCGNESKEMLYTVTNNGFESYDINYYINGFDDGSIIGDSNQTINVNYTGLKDIVLKFRVNASGHPFYIKDSLERGGYYDQYKFTINNGQDEGIVELPINSETPDILYYQCSNHSNMNGEIRINKT